MEAAVIRYAVSAVKGVFFYTYNLFTNAESNLEKLKHELENLEAFLADASRMKEENKDERFKLLVRHVNEVIQDMKDTIDSCLAHAEVERNSNFLGRTFNRKKTRLAEQVNRLSIKVKPLLDQAKEMPTVPSKPPIFQRPKEPFRRGNIIPLEVEMETLISDLTAESETLEVFGIVGMAGIGKTTLAWMIHNDKRIRDVFPTVIWVNVSQDFKKEDVCLKILSGFKVEKNLPPEKVDELYSTTLQYLNKGKFLIVLDDVWTIGAWNEMQKFLPTMSNKHGKVLITSRVHEVVKFAGTSGRAPHILRFLSDHESWNLIQLEVFGDYNGCPGELVETGKLIAHACGGLPFKVLVMAGILRKKWRTVDLLKVKLEWIRVSLMVNGYVGTEGGQGCDEDTSLSEIISLSYKTLTSPGLRDCFVYLGMFPEGMEIPVWSLIRLWIAEEFIKPCEEGRSLEEIAGDYLNDLIDKNLLMVGKRKLDGEIKTCRVHGSVLNFCKSDAVREMNLFQEVKLSKQGVFLPAPEQIKRLRRISIHSNLTRLMGMKSLRILKAHSFMSFSMESIILKKKHMLTFAAAFKCIRVFHAKAINFPELPANLELLKYLSVSCDSLAVLPKKRSKLCNLQTLELTTLSPKIKIKADLRKLPQLTDIKSKASITLSNLDGKGEGGEKLRSINALSPESCTRKLFSKVKNLRELVIRGPLAKLDPKCGLKELSCLEKLALVNTSARKDLEKSQFFLLPGSNLFPQNLTSLKLSGTYLDWKYTSPLGRLGYLEVLKLKDHAFIGETWDTTGCCFVNLTSLSIWDSDLTHWLASIENFPSLRMLILKKCPNLQEVPDELVSKLYLLHMEGANKHAISQAREVEQKLRRASGKTVLNLVIVPTEDDCQYTFMRHQPILMRA